MSEALLSVRDLSVDFSVYGRRSAVLRAVSLDVPARRHVALVGESGCGKSVAMRAIMGILRTPPASVAAGAIMFDGRDLLAMRPREREQLRMVLHMVVYSLGFKLLEERAIFGAREPSAETLAYGEWVIGAAERLLRAKKSSSAESRAASASAIWMALLRSSSARSSWPT